jgi:glycerol-3-phosphate dehydrogenase
MNWRPSGRGTGSSSRTLSDAARQAKLARWHQAVQRAGAGRCTDGGRCPCPSPADAARGPDGRLRASRLDYDIAIVGGGATGLGVALDAAARGFSVVLVESHDFAKGTSSRATKLVHGGVRYLAQGNIALVREALHERTTLLHNAPHLAQPLAFVMPSYQWWETPFYGIGLTMYDALAGKAGLGKTEFLSRQETLRLLPNARAQGLSGGVKYWDGQFNDARLAWRWPALRPSVVRCWPITAGPAGLLYRGRQGGGTAVHGRRNRREIPVRSRCVINATGVWVDALRQQDGDANPGDGRRPTRPMVAPSQGVHLVVDREFLAGDTA